MSIPVRRWLLGKGLIVKPEFTVPWGTCDFVGVRLDPTKVRLRLSRGQIASVGPQIRLRILAQIPDLESGTCVTLASLQHRLSGLLAPEVVLSELELLTRRKFVASPRKNSFCRLNGWAPLHRQIFAVELKLARVSEVLNQAAANRAFATHSYIALPSELARRMLSTRKTLLTRMGVGLLGVSRQLCRELLAPSTTDDAVSDDVIQSHVVERFWRARGN
jgi:hypothetical protein